MIHSAAFLVLVFVAVAFFGSLSATRTTAYCLPWNNGFDSIVFGTGKSFENPLRPGRFTTLPRHAWGERRRHQRGLSESAGERRSTSLNTVTSASVGILGETVCTTTTGIAKALAESSDMMDWPLLSDNDVQVRMASMRDDAAICNLRLSVFSGFTPEMKKQFMGRAIDFLDSRRRLGALCLVATDGSNSDGVVGSVECSMHEFSGSVLGQQRPPESLLYLTEVAVASAARRRGIGTLLLQTVEKLALLGKIETIYLHVEEQNRAARNLYRKAGYKPVPVAHNEAFSKFTHQLHLDEASRGGKRHLLLYKDLVSSPTWFHSETAATALFNASSPLGFEVQAF